MSRTRSFLAMLVVMLFPVFAGAQTTIKEAPAKPTSATSGAEMFKTYCAACHGLSGKGDGPAAPALKDAPADLTTLSARNGGKFPEAKVIASIKLGPQLPAHGSAEMPVWGDIFLSLNPGQTMGAEVQLRVYNLMNYIKSLQVK